MLWGKLSREGEEKGPIRNIPLKSTTAFTMRTLARAHMPYIIFYLIYKFLPKKIHSFKSVTSHKN